MGVSMYGQMTAGSYCYIGPQGIVHGTTVSSLAAVIAADMFVCVCVCVCMHVHVGVLVEVCGNAV